MPREEMEFVTIENISSQMVRIQIKPPGGDFYLDEQQIQINPNNRISVPKDHLLWQQIENFKAHKILRVIES
jgi:hypothetical protein